MAEAVPQSQSLWARWAAWPVTRLLAALMLLAVLLTLPAVILARDAGVDCSNWYAPMMRELAAGNWAGAFHPRIPPLFVISGVGLIFLGLSPFIAAKLASALWFAVGVLPVYGLQRQVFGHRVAALATLLYVLCTRLQRFAVEGIKDSAKTTLLVAMVWALLLVWQRPSWWRIAGVAVSGALLALVWSGGSVLLLLALGAVLWRDLRGRLVGRQAGWRWPWRTVAAGVLALTLLGPWLAYVRHATGLPLAEARHAEVLRRLGVGMVVDRIQQTPAMPRDPTRHQFSLAEVFKGLYPPYLLLLLPVLFWRWRRRQLAGQEWALLGLIIAFLILLQISVGWMSKRYVAAVLPLMLGWTAIALALSWQWLRERGWQRALTWGPIILFLAVLWDGAKPIIPPDTAKRRNDLDSVYACAQWLRDHGQEAVLPGDQPLPSTDLYYHSGRLPVIIADNPAVAMLADCGLFPARQLYLHLPTLLAMAQIKQVRFIVWSKELVDRCPALADLDALPPELTLAFDDRGRGPGGKVILRFQPSPTPATPTPGLPQDDPL
jgi:hypothetical protein